MVIINDDYIVEVDGRNYTLKSKYQKKTADDEDSEEFEFGTIGYYGNLKYAIKAAAEDLVRRKLIKGKHTLNESVEIINETYKEFAKLLDKTIEDFGNLAKTLDEHRESVETVPAKRGRKKKEQV